MFVSYLASGDRVAALRECYGGTLQQLEFGRDHFGWRLTYLSADDPGAWERVIEPGTKIVHVESPTNPILRVIDLRRAAALAHARGALLTVDGTFGPPVVQKPLALGADLVMHSATKYLGGHSDLLAGVVSGSQPLMESLWKTRRIFGAMLDPMSAWHLERGLKTLPLRMEAIHRNAMRLAERLESHPAVERVHYPGLARHPQHALAREQMKGFGGVVGVVVRGGGDAARTFAESLRVFRHGPSLGGVESLASLPAFTSHVHMTPVERAAAGIEDGLVRLAVGVEDETDLWADLENALSKARVGVA
jgi:cystathionine beta-lyase/cystathionine gamma-synthase